MIQAKTPNSEFRCWGFFIFALPVFFYASVALAQYKDHFKNYAELSAQLKENTDYKIETAQVVKAPVTLFAIHGGVIEPGSSELARELAKKDFSLYLFEGLNTQQTEAMHLTATHFDEPRALALAKESVLCVSTHGFIEKTVQPRLCVGGGNEAIKAKILASKFENVELVDCKTLRGVASQNIVNRCQNKGIQLEMSPELRERIIQDSAFKSRFALWIRSFLN